jgi:hypothetical protein
MPTTTRARVIQTLSLPQGAQIEIEYNPRRPSIRTIVRHVEALGYRVIVEPFRDQLDFINEGFASQHVGAHVLLITYPHPFDPRRNKEEIAMTRLQQVHIVSVDVEVTEDLLDIDPLAAPHIAPPYTISHIRRPVLGVLWSYRNTVSRGNNLMAPERIWEARASREHTV